MSYMQERGSEGLERAGWVREDFREETVILLSLEG